MLFSSLIFLFVFLPVVLLLYYTICRNMLAKNILLLVASLFFYAWGEPRFVLFMLLSIIVNYSFGMLLDKNKNNNGVKKVLLILDITYNLAFFFVFKYLNFTIYNINMLLGCDITQTNIALPIGISFFTFQAMSYVVDVYRETVQVQKNPFYVALYISYFPQLIAGPIVRYSTIEEQIIKRTTTAQGFSDGVRRFLIGLSKKIIIANNVALIADQAYSLVDTTNISVAFAWLGSLAYTLQIFFDFSAYSDMAIGLGKMFGFEFLENFDYPYVSKSVSEFWRRWHISLGTWFRDYVYFPLGGSRVDKRITLIRNLFVVWLLTGIWHGANWTFVCWGLFYFIILTIEKIYKIPGKFNSTLAKGLYRAFTLLCVNFGWVLFRATSIKQAIHYMGNMFGLNGNEMCDIMAVQYFVEYWVILVFAVIYSVGVFKTIRNMLLRKPLLNEMIEYSVVPVYIVLFIISISYLVMGAYNPFIYFNF